MKKLILLVVVLGLLVGGCATTLNDLRDKWGPPAKCEKRGELTVCYWYFYLGNGPAPDSYEIRPADWKCGEVTVGKDGKVIKVIRYWMQPKQVR